MGVTAATPPAITAEIAPGILLDSRRALVHQNLGWMAVADLHYGYEVHRSRQGALLPNWGMGQCRATLLALIHDHRPERLIIVGDIMDGSGSVAQTGAFLDNLRTYVPDLILIEGNHDRSGLKKGWNLQKAHREQDILFHHGHHGIAPPSLADDLFATHPQVTLVTGHEHPAVSLRDGAGFKLKLPAFVQQRIRPEMQHWILPAFSPWASGGEYTSEHEPLATWACAPARVWRLA
jgi:uncharacterized protein